jgi:hypothetical protein
MRAVLHAERFLRPPHIVSRLKSTSANGSSRSWTLAAGTPSRCPSKSGPRRGQTWSAAAARTEAAAPRTCAIGYELRSALRASLRSQPLTPGLDGTTG